MKKFFIVTLVVAFGLFLAACAGCPGEETPGVSDEFLPPGEVIRFRDLGGMEINITLMPGRQEECTETFYLSERLPDEIREQISARWEYRRELEERYNFRIRYVSYGEEPDWMRMRGEVVFRDDFLTDRFSWEDDFYDGLVEEIRAGNRTYTVWSPSTSRFIRLNRQGLFAPIPTEIFNESEADWNRCVWALSMRGGVPHAFSPEGDRWPSGGGIFFNMHLLEAAGLPRDLPYTLQAAGNWTWDELVYITRRIAFTQTADSEILPLAIMDTQGFTLQALASNDTDFATLDPITGYFVDTTDTPEFLQAMEWIVQLRDERLASNVMGMDESGEWRDSWSMFNDGTAAMLASSFHLTFATHSEDGWGFVAFPKGPNAQTHYTPILHRPLYVIPNFFSPEEVDDIIFALKQWYRPLGTSDRPDWMIQAEEFHPDPRSVDESMRLYTENPALHRMSSINMMPWTTWEDSFFHQWHTSWEWYSDGDWMNPQPDTRSAREIIDSAQTDWLEHMQRINN